MSRVFALFLLASGAAAAGPRCTLANGAPWQQFRSQHFVIDAAGFTGDPAKLVAAFEDLHAAVLAALVAEPVEIPSKLHAVVLPRERDLIDYTGSNDISGLFWASARGEPLILMSADQLESFPQVIAHELTHYISSYLFPRQSFWYAEGLAQLVESVGKPDRDGKRWAGGDAERGLDAGTIQFTSVQHLLYGNSFSTDDYLSAFVLYRYLWNEHPKELSAYQQKLMDGASPEDAWQAAFPCRWPTARWTWRPGTRRRSRRPRPSRRRVGGWRRRFLGPTRSLARWCTRPTLGMRGTCAGGIDWRTRSFPPRAAARSSIFASSTTPFRASPRRSSPTRASELEGKRAIGCPVLG
jgi:hypothetical protein